MKALTVAILVIMEDVFLLICNDCKEKITEVAILVIMEDVFLQY